MKKKILIVEDESDLRTLLVQFFEYKKFEVYQTENGKKALEMIDQNGYPDMVLTDLIMDEMEGIELIKTLKKRQQALKIIAMSGGGKIGADNYLEIVKVLGVDGILKKPFNLDDLYKMVQEHL